jgi:hypothetical protein
VAGKASANDTKDEPSATVKAALLTSSSLTSPLPRPISQITSATDSADPTTQAGRGHLSVESVDEFPVRIVVADVVDVPTDIGEERSSHRPRFQHRHLHAELAHYHGQAFHKALDSELSGVIRVAERQSNDTIQARHGDDPAGRAARMAGNTTLVTRTAPKKLSSIACDKLIDMAVPN